MTIPSGAPIPRVPRSRVDDWFDAGHPTPVKRGGSGQVESVQDDTVTCYIWELDELVAGVIPLGLMPSVGDIVDIESRGDLLVIPFWADEPEWLELPPRVRVMVDTGMTTPLGTDGFVPSPAEYGRHSMRLTIYNLNGPLFNPTNVFDDPNAWDCAWSHAQAGDGAGPDGNAAYWNNVYTNNVWAGSPTCEPPQPATGVTGVAATGTQVGAGWNVTTALSGGSDTLAIRTRSLAVWMDLSAVMAAHLPLSDPAAGYPAPVPPPGYELVWENPTPELTKIEGAIAEATSRSATNAGTVYAKKLTTPFTEFGPASTTSTAWSEGRSRPCIGVGPDCALLAYSGGTAGWVDITADINTSGRTWFLFVPDVLHDHARHWTTGRVPGDLIQAFRYDIQVAFQFTITPSRYKFEPIP